MELHRLPRPPGRPSAGLTGRPGEFRLLHSGTPDAVARGDRIEIEVAFGGGDRPVAFIQACRVNGRPLVVVLPRVYTANLTVLEPVRGRVAEVSRDGFYLVLRIAPAPPEGDE